MLSYLSGVRAVLFDLDGTLLDSAPDLASAADQLRALGGLPPLPLSFYRAHAGSGARGMLRVAFDMGPDHVEFERHKAAFFTLYEQTLTGNTVAFEGVEALLATLQSRGVAWGVVTNKAQRFALPLTASMPLFDRAAAMVCGDTTPYAKPHPEPVLEAARQAGFAPTECIYVGDDLRDIQAGKAAGMRTVAACYGYLGPGADVNTWGADAQVNSPLELLKLLDLP